MNHDSYPDSYIREILRTVRTIAMVGASASWNRPSYFAMKYLQDKGYRVIPVNPKEAGKQILGETAYPDLRSIPFPVDMVDCFRAVDAIPGLVDDAIAIRAKVFWTQLGIRHDEAASKAEQAGLSVVMDRCPKIEYGRLSGEMGWLGVNTGVLSSRRRLGRAPGRAVEKPAGFGTLAVHAGASPDPVTGARATPIYQTTSYVFEDADHAASLFNLQVFGNIYTRLGNPTTSVLEERIAALEGGRAAVAVGSGHAAQLVVFHTLMSPGDHIVASRRLYGGSITQLGHSFARMAWSTTFVDTDDLERVRAAITPRTKAIFVESIANPGGVISDLEALARIAHDHKIVLVVDNTLASPYLCQPLRWGADIVVHSATKFLGGHGNSMGGLVVDGGKFDWTQSGNYPHVSEPTAAYHGLRFHETFGDLAFAVACRAVSLRDLGPAISPFNAFMILTGMETLPLRMRRHTENALFVATYLSKHPEVAWVSYAGLPEDRYHDLALKYAPKGAGAVFTFGVKGGYSAGVRLVERVELFSHLANVGDTRSLIIHPASTTHRQLSEAERSAAGAGPEVVRLSIGIEDPEDLIADLDQALSGS